MEISCSYRGVKTVIQSDFNDPKISIQGNITFIQKGWSDGNKKLFTATIQPHELLITAKRCLEQLNTIAGTKYAVYENQASLGRY